MRRVLIDSEIVGYRLQRVRRRSIGFQIDERGLTVRAPRWITLRDIEAAIAENRRWISNKQSEWHRWRQQHRRFETQCVDGGHVQYLGQAVTLRVCANVGATHFDPDAAELHLALPTEATEFRANQVRQALHDWLQMQARCVIGARLESFSDRIDSRFAGWRLSSARTQWGSCSHDGRIRLSWRLVHFPLPVIDYVIAHELAHLRELNHSARFWRVLAELLPGFEAARDQIKRVAMPLS